MTTKVIEPSAGDILRHTITLLEEWGWTKREYLKPDGKMCMRGALNAAAGMSLHVQNPFGEWFTGGNDPWSTSNRAVQALIEVLKRLPHSPTTTGFNDQSTTTFEDVVAKLKQAADYADSQGW